MISHYMDLSTVWTLYTVLTHYKKSVTPKMEMYTHGLDWGKQKWWADKPRGYEDLSQAIVARMRLGASDL